MQEFILLLPTITLALGAIVSALLRWRDRIAYIPASVISAIASLLMITSSIYVLTHGMICYKVYTLLLCMDELSAFYILVLGILSFATSIYSLGYMKRFIGEYSLSWFGICYTLFLLTMYMVPLAMDMITFIVFWELMTLTSAFLVAYESRRPEAYRAAVKYFAMMMVGAGFIIAAFALMYAELRAISFMQLGAAIYMPKFIKDLVFAFLAVGFGFKAGIVPLHSWLPDAHPEAPSNVSALLSGIMIKMAFYGLMRFLLFLGFDLWWGIALALWGALSAIVGTFMSIMQNDSKKLLAYSSVAQVGYIALALGVAVVFLSSPQPSMRIAGSFAFIAALIHIMSHAMSKGSLFMASGALIYSVGTRNLNLMGGLGRIMPFTCLSSLIAGLALAGVPPLSGFVSKWMIYASALSTEHPLIALAVASAMFASILTAAAVTKFLSSAFLVERAPSVPETASEVPESMIAGMMITAAMCFAIGLCPLIAIVPAAIGIARPLILSPDVILSSLVIYPSIVFIRLLGVAAQLSSLTVAAIIGIVSIALLMFYKVSISRNVEEWLSGSTATTAPGYTAASYFTVFQDIYGVVYRIRLKLLKSIVDPIIRFYNEFSLSYELEQRYTSLAITIMVIALSIILIMALLGVI